MSGLSDFVLEVISNPEEIIKGDEGELIAIQKFKNNNIVVIYREVNKGEGFIITSFITSEIDRVRKGSKRYRYSCCIQ